MSESNVIHENFHTKHSVFTAPDEHMPYIIQLHIMSVQPKRERLSSTYVREWPKQDNAEKGARVLSTPSFPEPLNARFCGV